MLLDSNVLIQVQVALQATGCSALRSRPASMVWRPCAVIAATNLRSSSGILKLFVQLQRHMAACRSLAGAQQVSTCTPESRNKTPCAALPVAEWSYHSQSSLLSRTKVLEGRIAFVPSGRQRKSKVRKRCLSNDGIRHSPQTKPHPDDAVPKDRLCTTQSRLFKTSQALEFHKNAAKGQEGTALSSPSLNECQIIYRPWSLGRREAQGEQAKGRQGVSMKTRKIWFGSASTREAPLEQRSWLGMQIRLAGDTRGKRRLLTCLLSCLKTFGMPNQKVRDALEHSL